MLCSHQFGPFHVRKQLAECPQFLARNRHGGFFLWSETVTSKYQGLWTRMDGAMYKSIAQIRPGVDLPVRRAVNHLWGFAIDRGSDFHELFYMDPHSDSLIYEMKNPAPFSLILDAKEQSDQDEWGRFYDITEEDGCLFVSYMKKSGDAVSYEFTLAIAGYTGYEIKKEWTRLKYPWDVSRQDPPFERPVFNALSLTGKRVVFSVHTERKEALTKAQSVLARTGLIRESLERETDIFAKKHNPAVHNQEIFAACLAAQFSTEGMVVLDRKGKPHGVYAGIPWFTQFWVRDFVLSAHQIPHKEKTALVMGFFDEMEKNAAVHLCDQGKCATGADSELLLFSLAADMHREKTFTKEQELKITRIIIQYLTEVIPGRMLNGLVENGPKETWMDTQYQDDGRSGARIEIQALALKALHFAWQLTRDAAYRSREHDLAREVRLRFWDGDIVRDGTDDGTVRPNVFLAHHFYPDLFLKHEWERAFASVLDVLWLSWGGLATLPKTHPLFCGRDRTGTDPNQSYHHGDAWFFINNIAALSLARVNGKRFEPFIDKLLVSSAHDILWHGIAGSHSEVSSADVYEPRGCLAQTWSAATYADAVESIVKHKVQ